MLHRLLGEDIRIETRLAPQLDAVMADPGHMEQVLMNLVINARDAMPRGGRVVIETANRQLGDDEVTRRGLTTPGAYVALSVSDTGCGMNESVLGKVFEPFFTTKGHSKGTGLGLSTVYGIVKQSGGDIQVTSEVGVGSTFTIYLPSVGSEAIAGGHARAEAPSAGQGETILIAEDEDAVRTITARALDRAGFRVLIASSGDDALLLAETYPEEIHLLLSDVIMPGLSGPELARRLVTMRPRTKVLFMSGYTDDALSRHGFGVGTRMISKPFISGELTRKVREVLDEGSVVPSTGGTATFSRRP